MHRRLWLLAGAAAAAVLLVAASATAKTTVAGGSKASTLAAAPFSHSWAQVPRTAEGRKAKSVLVFGMEQDVTGFNVLEADMNSYWAAVTGVTPVVRGMYVIDNQAQYHLDLASSVKATQSTLTINIRPDANWYYGGKKVPVTGKDFAYTWQQIMDPKSNAASTTGYDQITGYTLKGNKTVIFKWSKPFADYRDLFDPVLPSGAVTGEDFNSLWSNCVCGPNGPVSDGPFYVSNYTRGQGMTLKTNPFWYGDKPKLKEVDFKIITDTNSEIQAMRGGEVDAIAPSPQTALSQLQNQSGITYSAVPGQIQEHVDIQYGPKGNPLLKSPWFRQAIMLGMDRPSLIKALYSQIAPGMKPLQNLLWNFGTNSTPDFAKWNFNQKKARDILAAHCTGGPSKPTAGNSDVWTCNGQKAELKWYTSAGNQRRATSLAIFTQQLGSIGIKVDANIIPANPNLFGQQLPNHDYDLAEYAWIGSPDPSGFFAIWGCGGGSNYTSYCNRKATNLMDQANSELDPEKRTSLYKQADAIMANDIPAIPLYASPSILVYKSAIKGMQDSNNPTNQGPTWNIENWSW